MVCCAITILAVLAIQSRSYERGAEFEGIASVATESVRETETRGHKARGYVPNTAFST